MLDSKTGLVIGDPNQLPFSEQMQNGIDEKLHENVEKRLKFGTATASGIRQIFDKHPTNQTAVILAGNVKIQI